MSELIINHEEAMQLACLHRETSNLGRCYIGQRDHIDALEAALRFYADPANWTEPGQANAQELFDTAMGADLGALARAALKQD